jgi:hypothetical protein
MPRSPSGLRLPTRQELIVPKPPGMEQGMLPSGKPSQKGWAQVFPRWDMHNPHQFAQTVRNLGGIHDLIKQHFPEEHAAGLVWHPKQHDVIARAIKGTSVSHLAGSGITAALSGGSEYEGQNIGALHHAIHKMLPKHWDIIQQAAAGGQGKTGAVRQMVHGTPLANVTLENLDRARRIREGEDPYKVIPPQTAPKEHYFMESLHKPRSGTPATIDFRSHDLATNRMVPAQYSGRGIGSAEMQGGKPTRYEKMAEAHGEAAHSRDIEHSEQLQASTWLGGKRIETLIPTLSGAPRTKGVPRRGQPYFHGEG